MASNYVLHLTQVQRDREARKEERRDRAFGRRIEDLRDLQDAVGELVKIHARLQILANAGTGELEAEVEAVVIEGISVFTLVAKYQARVHDSALDSLLSELSEASNAWTEVQKVGGEWESSVMSFTKATKAVQKRIGELLTDSD